MTGNLIKSSEVESRLKAFPYKLRIKVQHGEIPVAEVCGRSGVARYDRNEVEKLKKDPK